MKQPIRGHFPDYPLKLPDKFGFRGYFLWNYRASKTYPAHRGHYAEPLWAPMFNTRHIWYIFAHGSQYIWIKWTVWLKRIIRSSFCGQGLCFESAIHQDPCIIVQGTGAGKYASQLLKASCASYAKGLAPPALCRWCRKCKSTGIFPLSRIFKHANAGHTRKKP